MELNGEIVANPPNDLIYDFKGYFESSPGPRRRSTKKDDLLSGNAVDSKKESLSLENTMWANTVLASTGYALG